jgi:hypothetical protein
MKERPDTEKETKTDDDGVEQAGDEEPVRKGPRVLAFLKRLLRSGYRPEKSYMRGAKS